MQDGSGMNTTLVLALWNKLESHDSKTLGGHRDGEDVCLIGILQGLKSRIPGNARLPTQVSLRRDVQRIWVHWTLVIQVARVGSGILGRITVRPKPRLVAIPKVGASVHDMMKSTGFSS